MLTVLTLMGALCVPVGRVTQEMELFVEVSCSLSGCMHTLWTDSIHVLSISSICIVCVYRLICGQHKIGGRVEQF